MADYYINTDGGSRGNPGPAASAFVVRDSQNNFISQGSLYLGNTTNNIAEYSAVLIALQWLEKQSIKIDVINFRLDSLLVVNQLNGKFRIKDQNLYQKYIQIKKILMQLKKTAISFSYIPRSHNSEADAIVNLTLDAENI